MFLAPVSEPYRLNVGARDGPAAGYPSAGRFSALRKLATYSSKARRPAGVACSHVRGLRSWNSFRDYQIAGVFQLPQMGGQIAAGKAERLLDEPIGEPALLRLGDQQSHYPQPCGLVDGLVEDYRLVGHGTPVLRIHIAASAATISVRTADTSAAASMSR